MKRAGLPALFFIPVFLLGLACYGPAFNGPFVLDDQPNFYGLRFIRDFSTLLDYMLHGESGIRWLSYLSFIPHANDFVAQKAFYFKLVNFLLHGLNSLLAFELARRLLQALHTPGRHSLLALAIAAVWFLHPIHAGTVLYSVQRMTLLAGTLVLSGCLLHLHWLRQARPANTRHWAGYTVLIWSATLCSILAKENGILLLAFIALLNHALKARPFRPWQQAITLLLPFAALLAYLLATRRLAYYGRDFSLLERLLSQVVIVQEYLSKIILPLPDSFSIFHDDFLLISSATETRFLLALMFWACLLFVAWVLERQARGFMLGIGWFFTGHLLESTFIPLELYYDHRNYLPSLGLVFSAGVLLAHTLAAPVSARRKTLAAGLALLLVTNQLFSLSQETRHWRSETALANHLYQTHPHSLRTLQFLTENQFRNGQLHDALLTVEKIQQDFGSSVPIIIFHITVACMINPDTTLNLDTITTEFRRLKYTPGTSESMQSLFSLAKSRKCKALDLDGYRQLLLPLLEKRLNAKENFNLFFLLVSSYIHQQNHAAALEASLKLPASHKKPMFVLMQIDLAIRTGNKALVASLYDELGRFDSVDKLIYKDQINELDHYLKDYLNER